MQEKQVTIGDTTFKLDRPFLVLAKPYRARRNLPASTSGSIYAKTVIDYPKWMKSV
jgi:MoxR-like ATPase